MGQPKDIEIDEWPYAVISIEDIVVLGNDKTHREEVLRISGLKEGDELGRDRTFEAKRRLLSAGVFEEVFVRVKSGSEPGKAQIEIELKEKTTWFIAPYFSVSQGSLGGGLAVAESHLFGRSKQLLVGGAYSNRRKALIAGYRDPSMFRSMVTLDVDSIIREELIPQYRDGEERIRDVELFEYGGNLLPGLQWTSHFRTSAGVFFRRVEQKLVFEDDGIVPLTPGDLRNGTDIAGSVRFQFDNTDYVTGLMSGISTELEVHLSDKRFWSDFEYTRQSIRLNWGNRFGNPTRIGVKSSVAAQFGQGLPYYRQLSAGGTNLRGYKADAFRGDTRYALTNEFQMTLRSFSRFVVRGLLFWDAGVVYFREDNFQRDDLKNGIGMGLRVYLRGVDIPAFGYDMAWGIEGNNIQHYLNIGTSF
jgi:outer membrane protein assembly factor BamA